MNYTDFMSEILYQIGDLAEIIGGVKDTVDTSKNRQNRIDPSDTLNYADQLREDGRNWLNHLAGR